MLLFQTKKYILESYSFIISLALCFAVVIVCASLFRYLDARIGSGTEWRWQPIKMSLNTLLESTSTIAEAASLGNQEQDRSARVRILERQNTTTNPLQKTHVTVRFSNTGKKTWKAGSVTLRASARGESYLHNSSWIGPNSVIIIDRDVEPRTFVDILFEIESPKKPGSYTETFFLFAQGASISGSAHRIKTTVINAAGNDITPRAQKLMQSSSVLTLAPGEITLFKVGFKNVGTSIWKAGERYSLRSLARKESFFSHPSWESDVIAATFKKDVGPGELAFFSIQLEAPQSVGMYTEKFSLYRGVSPLSQTEVSLPITVMRKLPTLAHAPLTLPLATNPTNGNSVATSNAVARLGVIDDVQEIEKNIRVGVYYSREPQVITANRAFVVIDAAGTIVANYNAQESVAISFDDVSKLYSLVTPAGAIAFGALFHFQGLTADADTLFELPSFSSRPVWNTSLNDNRFRNAIEFRYAAKTDRAWVINELPVESYLKGIAETSNSSPYEYQKALIIAARTFAKYHIDRNTKYLGEYFTVRASDYDQVYRGYNAELRLPSVSRAVEETRGVVVYYNNALAITPYYSQSDGRTRSWDEVWAGGGKAWLISVPDSCCTGLPLLGHGVGMSARGGLVMAQQGKTFEEIVKYYYTGIELRHRW